MILIKFFSFLLFVNSIYAEPYIEVYKKNVLHKFVPFDTPTDHFTSNVFKEWENETFDIFDEVKDQNGIAIDLGAWIGTTSIWLSKNFYHVIAVEPDIISLQCLMLNLKASECNNLTICHSPIYCTKEEVVFGPIGENLNESISQIKPTSTRSSDYLRKTITLKQLIYDYIYQNEEIADHKVSFIKCDIEGGEEFILEDLLYFAHNNNCKLFISFHLDFWTKYKITDF